MLSKDQYLLPNNDQKPVIKNLRFYKPIQKIYTIKKIIIR